MDIPHHHFFQNKLEAYATCMPTNNIILVLLLQCISKTKLKLIQY